MPVRRRRQLGSAGLLSRAVGKQLTCVFVDQGLMRKDEGDFVEQTFTTMFDMNFVRVNCGELFMSKLKGVTDPEEKAQDYWHRVLQGILE